MNYRVFWFPDAEQRLNALLAVAEEPQQLAEAAQEIDRHLAANPFDFGESRENRVRVGFVKPLAVEFEMLRDVSTVIVFNVWRTERRPR